MARKGNRKKRRQERRRKEQQRQQLREETKVAGNVIPMEKKDNLVFVYGTLKKNFSNHRLLQDQVFLGNATVKGLKLFYSYGKNSFPVAIPHPRRIARGEVYRVSDACLRNLDALEGYNKLENDMYKREKIEMSGHQVNVYIGGRGFKQKAARNELEEVPPITKGGLYHEWKKTN